MRNSRTSITFLLILFSLSACFSQKIQTGQLEKYRGKLPFPVCSVYGYSDAKCIQYSKISPSFKNITFITDSASEVRAIFNGKVYKIFTIENEYVVVINSGSYFITYYPVKKPGLKKGDFMTQGQPISKVGYLDNAHEINILISKSTNFIDPYKWFRW